MKIVFQIILSIILFLLYLKLEDNIPKIQPEIKYYYSPQFKRWQSIDTIYDVKTDKGCFKVFKYHVMIRHSHHNFEYFDDEIHINIPCK